jgi:pyrophosphatase PpaX
MSSYDYLLFDWDGTIAKTLNIWSDALKEILAQRGHSFVETEIGANYEIFREQNHHLGTAEVDYIVNQALLLSDDKMPLVELYSDQLKTLALLQQAHKKLGIVTTSKHAIIDALLDKHDMANLFDVVVCGDDVTQQKPHAEPIDTAIRLLSAKKVRTLMIGDSDKDILSARNAGIDSVLFYPPEHKRFHDIAYLKSLNPTYVIESFTELLDIVAA